MKSLACLLLLTECILTGSTALAVSLTVPISNLAPATDDRRVGDFDFGVQFSKIESINFEFAMPDGYQGTVMTTGNSTYSRSLYVMIHAHTDTIQFIDYGPAIQIGTPVQSIVELAPNQTSGFHLGQLLGPNQQPIYDNFFPEFLHSGRGSVTFTDFQLWTTHPLPDGIPTGSNSKYFLPGEISLARITITGTVVPEPSTFLALGIVGCCIALVRARPPIHAKPS